MEYKYIGTISSVKGYKGEIILSDCPEWKIQLKPNTKVKIGFSEKFSKIFTIKSFTSNKGFGALNVAEISNDKEAISLKEQGVFVSENDLEEKKGKVFAGEFNGFKVVNAKNNDVIGKVKEYWQLPANDCILVETKDGDLPIPFIDDFILSINKRLRVIKINLMDGLMDLLNNERDED